MLAMTTCREGLSVSPRDWPPVELEAVHQSFPVPVPIDPRPNAPPGVVRFANAVGLLEQLCGTGGDRGVFEAVRPSRFRRPPERQSLLRSKSKTSRKDWIRAPCQSRKPEAVLRVHLPHCSGPRQRAQAAVLDQPPRHASSPRFPLIDWPRGRSLPYRPNSRPPLAASLARKRC